MQPRTDVLRGVVAEVLGPGRLRPETPLATFDGSIFRDPVGQRRGPLAWQPAPDDTVQEVLYYDRENPARKYGTGVLHPGAEKKQTASDAAAATGDTVGVDVTEPDESGPEQSGQPSGEGEDSEASVEPIELREAIGDEDFDISSPDVRRPSTFGLSFCVRFNESSGSLRIDLPRERAESWLEDGTSLPLNGIYEKGDREWTDEKNLKRKAGLFRRRHAVPLDCAVNVNREELKPYGVVRRTFDLKGASDLILRLELYPRQWAVDEWLITAVVRNCTPASVASDSARLYQAAFHVAVGGGELIPYPESQRPFEQLDDDERSLALLYRDAATYAIGHGCAAGWRDGVGTVTEVFTDFMPVVELPSMTPDAVDGTGALIGLRMRDLSELTDGGTGLGWDSLERLLAAYQEWIDVRENEREALAPKLAEVAGEHLERCRTMHRRMKLGMARLKADKTCREAFRLANKAMLLQQIATKKLSRRPLGINGRGNVGPLGEVEFPNEVLAAGAEGEKVGQWRAFQAAFLLSQIDDLAGDGANRDVVDLIWFPTGGGKTEAYLGVLAFHLFFERLRPQDGLRRDGTNALMRYTLRMLTTQQFQRAASLICAMEVIRRQSGGAVTGSRFSVGLWIGGDGTPNRIDAARTRLKEFRDGRGTGNPMVLTECPWCRAEIGRFEGKAKGKDARKTSGVYGVTPVGEEGPLLHCTDPRCAFGSQDYTDWLPVEVIDERIYRVRPSLIIATADKFAMMAYVPGAGALFGREIGDEGPRQVFVPPGLIIQDELHLISGPLGTLYGLYESIIERFCVHSKDDREIRPKIISSTATIRGASDQIKSLFARLDEEGEARYAMFPPPGITMADSFFGRYARNSDGRPKPGRRYVGIHATEYGSILTTQVRTFSAALREAYQLPAEERDAWWTLLVFYNSIRELAGAKTLFESDIKSRLKFIQNREGATPTDRRNLRIVEELTSRLNQAEIVGMMDQLASRYGEDKTVDACLASSIIEVGVDIDRLSLMAVVGQPKTTAQYIQVTGRVGRRWEERPGLILTVYNPGKSRDRSHFEQFHTYHRRLYEKVEPTSATPFAPSSIARGGAAAALLWARQHSDAPVHEFHQYVEFVREAAALLRDRCKAVQVAEDVPRSLAEIDRVMKDLERKWKANPQDWQKFPPSPDGEYLVLSPGQFSTPKQRQMGVFVPTSLRQVDGAGELQITEAYAGGGAD